MAIEEISNERHLRIRYDGDRGWLHADWTGYQSVDSVKQGCEEILRLMAERSTFLILNDNTNVLGIWSGAAEWVAVDWFPRMRRAGLKCFAWVYSPSRFSQVSTDETLALMGPEKVAVQLFHDIREAEEWLRACA